ncbi:MAG: hypothetical protein D6730_08725 [Bacteroidetes bacterium]|nr:MAG: hypothetical protein D6730_08725 [Bacteroidota bacterium]
MQHLSIDVAAGGLASGAMFVCVLHADVPPVWWLALPLSIWVIYTTDHLLDAYRLKDKAHTPRHLFHHQYFRSILLLWATALVCCLTVIPLYAPRELWYFGMGMGILVLMHLGINKWIGNRVSYFFHKELGVALIYSLGVWGGPAIYADKACSFPALLLWAQFFLLALINLLMFAMFEIQVDEQDGHTSFARAIGESGTENLIRLLAATTLLLSIYTFICQPALWKAALTFLLMLGLLMLIICRKSYFGRQERYRMLGDAIFIIPLWVYLLA